ncbi:MAG: LamG-like jellyroll fold domain-containing protein [Bacteroidota bacterium]
MKRVIFALAILACINVKAQSNFALNFDGVNQTVSIGNPVATGSSYTKEAWVYATSVSGAHNVISSLNAPFWIDAGTLSAGHAGSFSLVTDAGLFPLNIWVHVAVTYDDASTTMRLYRDGVLVNTNTSVPSYTTEATYVASLQGSTSFFEGNIDEARIWSIPLTQSQIKQLIFRGPAKTTPGLSRLYKFNEGSGSILIDSTGTADGTLINSPLWVASPVEGNLNSLHFDGADDNVVIPNTVSGDFTVEYWMNTTSTGGSGDWYNGNGIVDAEVGGGTEDWGTSLNGNLLSFGIGNPDLTIYSTSDVNTGSWVHVAASWDQSTGDMSLYINGVLEATGTSVTTAARTAPPRITLGQLQTDINFYEGAIDELRIWDVVRSGSEISANMNSEINPAAETNLVAYYSFNQGITAGTNTDLLTLMDMKSTNNGTLSNFAMSGGTSNFIAQFASITPLPLVWLSYSVQKQNVTALLNWTTSAEKNTKDFTVKHSTDGVIWNDIATLKAIGNINEVVNSYSYVHQNPVAGMNYYRVLQTDKDGKMSFSPTKTLYFDKLIRSFAVNNPVVDGRIAFNVADESEIRLYNIEGKLLHKNIAKPGMSIIDVQNYVPGIYFLKVNDHTEKISIQ